MAAAGIQCTVSRRLEGLLGMNPTYMTRLLGHNMNCSLLGRNVEVAENAASFLSFTSVPGRSLDT